MLYLLIPIYKIIKDITVIAHKPIGENIVLPIPKNFGTDPINKAKVNNPKAIPLLLSNILLSAVSVIGIVMLKNRIAKMPKIGLLNANIKQTDDIVNEIIEIFLKPILSPIIPPSIFPSITANMENNANNTFALHSNANINPT